MWGEQVRACHQQLDRCCQDLVDSLCLLPRPATVEQLSTLVGHPVDADLEAALGRLEERALVFRRGHELHLLPVLAQLAYPAGLGPPAEDVLGRRPAGELGQVAKRLGVAPGRTKAHTLAAVVAALSDPHRAGRLVAGGPPGTAELARRLAHVHPAVAVPGGFYGLNDRTPIGWLANRGLVGAVSWDTFVMPGEVGLALREGRLFPAFCARRPPLAPAPVDPGAVDRAAAEAALRLVADVAAVLEVAEVMARYGRLVLEVHPVHGLVLRSTDRAVLEEVVRAKPVAPLVGPRIDADTVSVPRGERGRLKQALLKVGWPAEDRAGYVDGAAHPIVLHDGAGFELRPYQREAVEAFLAAGSGVVVLPCGAGKTLVGASAMARAGARTLILVTNTVAARQWRAELLARTSLTEAEIGEYSGERKEVRPVTLATYQILTTRRRGLYPHLELLSAEDWGLFVYDEVHLLPAPVFRMAAEIQSRRRLGLTATLVREDGREGDVFSLIGPKRYDAPWRDIEAQGWIAPANCTEVRVTLADEERMAYALAEAEERYRVGATARSKLTVVEALCAEAVRRGEPTLPTADRQRLYDAFRRGEEPVLVVSKVANFSIDLPEASVAIQVSGTFGSRQEEAQRLARILRPKRDGRQAHFFAVVSRDTNDQEFAARRQRFLAEQGYAYRIADAEAVLAASAGGAAMGELPPSPPAVTGPDATPEIGPGDAAR